MYISLSPMIVTCKLKQFYFLIGSGLITEFLFMLLGIQLIFSGGLKLTQYWIGIILTYVLVQVFYSLKTFLLSGNSKCIPTHSTCFIFT